MVLKGKAKRDYQREYMRRNRSNKSLVSPAEMLAPIVRPEGSEIYKKLLDKQRRDDE